MLGDCGPVPFPAARFRAFAGGGGWPSSLVPETLWLGWGLAIPPPYDWLFGRITNWLYPKPKRFVITQPVVFVDPHLAESQFIFSQNHDFLFSHLLAGRLASRPAGHG